MKLDHHSNIHAWMLSASGAAAGILLYRFIPRHHLAAGTVTAGILVLIILKHVGLLGIFGAPVFGFLRRRRADR